MHIREMTMQDFDAVLALWQSVEGVGLSDADAREPIARYLERLLLGEKAAQPDATGVSRNLLERCGFLGGAD